VGALTETGEVDGGEKSLCSRLGVVSHDLTFLASCTVCCTARTLNKQPEWKTTLHDWRIIQATERGRTAGDS
jgi:hypothetical protein